MNSRASRAEDAWSHESLYVPARDGTLLAAYVFRPRGEYWDEDKTRPAVWAHDRYHQVRLDLSARDNSEENRWAPSERRLQGLDNLGSTGGRPRSISLENFPWAQRLLSEGYVVVVVDSRGSGASFGTSSGPFAPIEAADLHDITEWIAAQPWCDGKVGMFGRSYSGISQYMAARAAPPHLVAIFPQMAMFDLYDFAYGGGIFREDFARTWGDDTITRDREGAVLPLDSDPSGECLRKARAEHQDNRDVLEMFERLCSRESVDPVSGERVYTTRSPSFWVDEINASGVAVYHVGGWFDIWARDALRWACELTVPRKFLIGPWEHTGGLNGGSGISLAEEHIRWFDYWLKGVENGVMDGPTIVYHRMATRGESVWRGTDAWPPPALHGVDLYPDVEGRDLSFVPPRPGALRTRSASYTVDYEATSGLTSRWASGYGGSFHYGDMAKNDERALCFTTNPLDHDLVVTGEPTLRLSLSSRTPKICVFVYLESVDATGVSTYVTEGGVRTDHDRPVPEFPGEPDRSQPRELFLSFQPTSFVFAAGTRIRLAITGADKDNALTKPVHPPPVIELLSSDSRALRLTLPHESEGAGAWTLNFGSDRENVPQRETGPSDRTASSSRDDEDAVLTRIVSMWNRVLEIEHIGPDDNFFEAGGTSRQMIKLLAGLREEFGTRTALHELFVAPTPREQALLIRNDIGPG